MQRTTLLTRSVAALLVGLLLTSAGAATALANHTASANADEDGTVSQSGESDVEIGGE